MKASEGKKVQLTLSTHESRVLFSVWGWLNLWIRNLQIQKADCGLEHSQILVSMVGPGTHPSWVLRDDCMLFKEWEPKRKNETKLNYRHRLEGREERGRNGQTDGNIRDWKTSVSVCAKKKHTLLLDVMDLIFFNSSELLMKDEYFDILL